MERAAKVAVVPVDIGWNDVGSWTAIHEINVKDENGNVALGAEHLAVDTRGDAGAGQWPPHRHHRPGRCSDR